MTVNNPKKALLHGEEFYVVAYDNMYIYVRRDLITSRECKFSLSLINQEEYCSLWTLANSNEEYLNLRNMLSDEYIQECI